MQAMYLLLLRKLNRNYQAVVQLVDTIASDTHLTLEENNSLNFLNSPKNSADQHPDAHACRLKISLVMLDSPVSPPWDLSVEMSWYVRKLQHVSANCKLTPNEELTLLGQCVCDPADKRFSEGEKHTHYSVLLCKNRRAALRAALAISSPPSEEQVSNIYCAVEAPPRSTEFRWIYEWRDDLAAGVTEESIDALLQSLSMKYTHFRSLQLETMLQLLGLYNQRQCSMSIGSGVFLLLYNLFNGAVQCRCYRQNCSQSFASLLLPFFTNELRQPTPLNALLLTLARAPLLGPFLPPFIDDRKHKRRELLTGLPLPDEENAPLGSLIRNVLRELSDLGGPVPRRHQDASRTMLARRVDVLTKERMWTGWGSAWGESSSGGWGAGWGSGGWGNASSWNGGGASWTGGQTSYQRLEQLAKTTETQCAEELKSAAVWRDFAVPPLKALASPATSCCVPLDGMTMRLAPATVSDHACTRRLVRAVPACSAEEIRHFCGAPLQAVSARWCTQLGRAELGLTPVEPSLGFDVSAHPDADSKVARDMQTRLGADAREFAEQINPSASCRLTFLLQPDAIVADSPDGRESRARAELELRELMGELMAQREHDSLYVRRTLPALLERANAVPLDATTVSANMRAQHELFALRKLAKQEAIISADFLLCLLISSNATEDLRRTNPFVTAVDAEAIFDELVSAVLHASRVGQINRCVSEAHGLLSLLCPNGGSFGLTDAARSESSSAIILKAQSLAEQLLTRRHYVEASRDPTSIGLEFDPRFLLFEFQHNLVLRKVHSPHPHPHPHPHPRPRPRPLTMLGMITGRKPQP